MSFLQKIIYIIPFIAGLVLVRMYEDAWFYDPFLNYFRGAYQNNPLPEIEEVRLFLSLMFRYCLNAFFSLGIIFFLFRNKEFLKVAGFLYLVFFVILISLFFYIVNYTDNNHNFALFYIRRFLIQPLFLLLFLPAFYFQLKSKNS